MHKVETMAYAGATPWHGLGVKVEEDLTPSEMVRAAELNWTVSVRSAHVQTEAGTFASSPDWNMLVRDSDERIFGPCGKKYQPVQNEEIFAFFDEFVKQGDMTMGTAGSLDDGRQVWGLANIQQGFTLADGDEVQGHLLISCPHVWGKSLTIMFTPVRVVCNNTLTYALGQTNQTRARFTMPHIHAFDVTMQEKAKEALGLASHQLAEFEERAAFLAKRQYTEPMVTRYLTDLYQPAVLHGLGSDEILDRSQLGRTSEQVFELISTQPGAAMSEGSWWSVLNAVTYHTDHKAGRDRDASLHSAWFGPRAALKRRALTLASHYAQTE